MCISCGCDEPEANHGNSKHITLKQFRDAAQAAEVDMGQLLKNIEEGFKRYARVKITSVVGWGAPRRPPQPIPAIAWTSSVSGAGLPSLLAAGR
jgi:hypothetical protein